MEAISHIIITGLLKDLSIAERSYLLNKRINELHESINNKIKTRISTILFDLTYTEMVLSLARLYDNTNKRFPTRCIKRLYETIKEQDYDIEINQQNVLYQIRYLGFPDNYIHLLQTSTPKDFNERAINFFESDELNEPICSAIEKIKQIRDKLLGHNEDFTLDTLVHYEKIETLLVHAKNVISFFALAYSDIHLQIKGDFYLSNNSLDWKRTYEEFVNNSA